MSDVPDLDADGLPEELSAFDQILHRGEANPRTRSGIMTLEILDSDPDWDQFRRRFDNASRKVLQTAAEGRHADAADGGAAVGDRSRLQSRLPRPPDPDLRTWDPAPGAGSRRRRGAIAARYIPTAVDGDPDRGTRGRRRRDHDASQPRRDRRCRGRRDVRPHLRPGTRTRAAGDSAAADPTRSLAQRLDAPRGSDASRARSRAGCAAWCPAPPTLWAKRSATRSHAWAASSTTRCPVPE